MSQPTWSFNGSAIARTSPLGATWTVSEVTTRTAMLADRQHKHVEMIDGLVDQGAAHLSPVRDVEFVVEADVSTLSGSDVDAKMADGWAELTTAFDPTLGVVKLQSARLNVSGATITRYLLVELTDVPTLEVRTAKPGNLDDSGAYAGHSGYIVYRAKARTVFPYWIGSALLTLDTAPATAELAIGASPDTVTINNAGRRWVGLRVTFGSVSGSVTSVTIANDVNSDSLIITNAGGFANGDYLDFLATDPRKIDRLDSANRFGGGTYRMRLETGSQTLTGSRTAGSGTCTLSLSWPELHLTN